MSTMIIPTKTEAFVTFVSLVGSSFALGYFLGAEGSLKNSGIKSSTIDDYNTANIILGISVFFLTIASTYLLHYMNIKIPLFIPFMIALCSTGLGIMFGYKNQIISGKESYLWASIGLLGAGMILLIITSTYFGGYNYNYNISTKKEVGLWIFIALLFVTSSSLLSYVTWGSDVLIKGTNTEFATIATSFSWLGFIVATGMAIYTYKKGV